MKRGRKKGKKLNFGRMPYNYIYWCMTLKSEKLANEFLLKGNTNQRNYIIDALGYMRIHNSDIFEDMNGEVMLKKFQESLKKEHE